MAQYRVGTISVTSGSADISGAGTLWDSIGIEDGSLINLEGNDGWYYIASVGSNTLLSLTAPYSGDTAASQSYVIVRDYLDYDIPLMLRGDINWTSIFNEAMLKIKIQLDEIYGEGSTSGSGLGLDAAYDAENEIAVDTAPVILRRIGTYESATRAPSLHVIDTNTSGPTELSPLDGGLLYAYSPHRTAIIGVTNTAVRATPGSQSSYANTAILGIANADDPDEFVGTYPDLKNVGITAISTDYHNTYGYSDSINVGMWAHSRRGYGINASSDATYAINVSQTTSPGIRVYSASGVGMSVSAYQPLSITNQGYITGTNEFAIDISSRRGGINVETLEIPTSTYPGIKVSSSGVSLGVTGQSEMTHTTTVLTVVGGSAGNSAVEIESSYVGLDVRGGSGGAIRAYSTSYPAITSEYGINIYTDDPDDIVSPPEGVIVYSGVANTLAFYNGTAWQTLIDEEANAVTLYDAYVNGAVGTEYIINIDSAKPVTVISAFGEALNIQNTNSTASNAAVFNSLRGWGVSASSQATNASYGVFNAVASGIGTVLKGTTVGGKVLELETGGRGGGYAATLECGAGGGMSVSVDGEPSYSYGPLRLESTIGTLIVGATTTGKLIDYTALTGSTQGDSYAVTLNAGTGGGISIASTGSIKESLRISNPNSAHVGIYASGMGVGIDLREVGKGMRIGATTSYAVEALRSNGGPAIYSQNGIVPYAVSRRAVRDPVPGTLIFSNEDKYMYYYLDTTNGWFPVAIPSGWEVPSGSPGCYCIDGCVIYTTDIRYLSGAPEEGTIVYNAADELVYICNFNHEFVQIGGGGMISGGSGGSRGVNVLVAGTLTEADNVASLLAPFDGTLVSAKAEVDSQPVGADINIDILVEGGTVLGGSLLTIPADAFESTQRSIMCSITQFQTISINIEQVGSTSPGGSDLRLILYFVSSEESGEVSTVTLIDSTDSPYNVVATDRFISVNSSSGNVIINLLSPASSTGIPLDIKKSDSSTTYSITVSGNIDGDTAIVLDSPWQALSVISNGTIYNIT
jgi:hypothetical protein